MITPVPHWKTCGLSVKKSLRKNIRLRIDVMCKPEYNYYQGKCTSQFIKEAKI